MKIAFFDTQNYEREIFNKINEKFSFSITYFETRLTAQSAPLAQDHDVVCCFVNDRVDKECLGLLKLVGVRMVALRCAGFNQVDLGIAKQLGLEVVRVPDYGPNAVAEHTLALLLSVNRKLHIAARRVREGNFKLDGLVGFNLAEIF